MAKADLGIKRTCLSCGMRFYDFKRTPILCPGCGTEFDPEALVRSKRSRAATKSVSKADADQNDAPANDDEAQDNESDVAEVDVDAVGENSDSSEDIDYDESDINVDEDESAGLISDDLDEDDDILPGIGQNNDE